MTKIRVLLVDDHAIVRLGLTALLGDVAEVEIVGEAGTAAEALKAVERLRPDVVLMDIRMPGEGGIEATHRITTHFPDTKVVMLTSFADEELVVRAIRAGAMGYVLKEVGNSELLRAITAAFRGEALLDPATTARLLARVRQTEQKADQDAFRDLSGRELDVVAEVARGKTNAEIAQTLNLSEKTVRNYLSTVLEKLNLTNRVALATFAVEHHLFDQFGKK